MSLANLIHGKSASNKIATATPATFATHGTPKGLTVASVATVAVANGWKPVTVPALSPLPDAEQSAIRAWLALIEETDPATIAEVIERCQRDADARAYYLARAELETPKPDPFPDDRRTCQQCANLIGARCLAAKRGEIVASRNYEPAEPTRPQRCEGYAPGPDDPDRRRGRERWPGLIQKGGE